MTYWSPLIKQFQQIIKYSGPERQVVMAADSVNTLARGAKPRVR